MRQRVTVVVPCVCVIYDQHLVISPRALAGCVTRILVVCVCVSVCIYVNVNMYECEYCAEGLQFSVFHCLSLCMLGTTALLFVVH